jgi:hypothetical protein
MANEIKEEKVEVLVERDCSAEAAATMKFMKLLGADEAEYLYVAQIVRTVCEATKEYIQLPSHLFGLVVTKHLI